jgi:hypothetical protein
MLMVEWNGGIVEWWNSGMVEWKVEHGKSNVTS